jgi:hypothetical protein
MSYPYHADHPNVGNRDDTESTPELPELQQEAPSIDVKGQVEVVNSVRTYDLPSRHGLSRSYTLQEGVTMPLLGKDMRRKSVRIWGVAISGTVSKGIYVGTKEDVDRGDAALIPYGQAIPISHAEQIYVKPQGNTFGTDVYMVSFISENWAD